MCDSIAAQPQTLQFSLFLSLFLDSLLYILLAFATGHALLHSPTSWPPAIVRLPNPRSTPLPVRVVPWLTIVAITVSSRESLEKNQWTNCSKFKHELSSLSLTKYV